MICLCAEVITRQVTVLLNEVLISGQEICNPAKRTELIKFDRMLSFFESTRVLHTR